MNAHALAPVARCLSLRGHAITAHELEEGDAIGASLTSIARVLARRGIAALTRRIDDGDFAYLRTPAVVELAAGELAILHEVGRSTCTLEARDGRVVRLSHADMRGVLGPLALELDADSAGRASAHGAGILADVARALVADATLRRASAHILVLAVAQNLLGLLVPLLTQWTLTRALPDGARSTLGLLTLATGGVALQQATVSFLRSRTLRYVELKLQERQLAFAFQRLLALPFARAHAAEAGDLHGALHAAEVLPSIVVVRIALPAIDTLLAFSYVALLAGGLAWAGVVLVVAAFVCLGASAVAAHRIAKHDSDKLIAAAVQQSALYELISGMSTLRAAGAERPRAAAWLGTLASELSAGLRSQLVTLAHTQIVDASTNILSSVLLIWGAQQCLDGALETGALVASLQACGALWAAVSQGVRIPMAVVNARALANRASAALASDGGSGSRATATRAEPRAGVDAIAVRDLWFRPSPETPWLFSGLDLHVARGENVRISWPSGAGKSTLLRLVAGLYAPERGTVSIFGLDASTASDLVGYVPQTSVLFSGSVLDNLRLLSGTANIDRIAAAASVTGLDRIVAEWPMGMETIITQGGGNVSSGQKQLITLTAAIASERPILLLDESTAHLDRLALARLESCIAFVGRTVVTVVHDGGAVSE